MSRVLKFRAWSYTHKKMYDRVLAGPGDPCSIVWDEERNDWANFDDACGVIMQFTGMLDCSGKEIFEGDLVRVVGYDRGEVAFGKAGFLARCTDGHLVLLENMSSQWLEVIGNLYETPNLLKEQP